MEWSKIGEERNERGDLTDLALAMNAIEDFECDCVDNDDPFCVACLCETALKSQWERIRALEASVRVVTVLEPDPKEIQKAAERIKDCVTAAQIARSEENVPSVALTLDFTISPHWRVKWKQGNAVGEFECVCLACPEKDKRIEELTHRSNDAWAAYKLLRASFEQEEDDNFDPRED